MPDYEAFIYVNECSRRERADLCGQFLLQRTKIRD